MREAPMYPDLAVQLSLLLRSSEFCLADQFGSKNCATIYVLELVALGKATFAEEASLNISSSDPLAITIQESLLYKWIRKALKMGCFIQKGHLLIRNTSIFGYLLITCLIGFYYASC